MLDLLNRDRPLFQEDLARFNRELEEKVKGANFLVIGGAGTIGQAVVKEIFKRDPERLHVVDINENNMTELVRDIRSSLGYRSGDFETFILDYGSSGFTQFYEAHQPYDYVLNLSALKHVRSEQNHIHYCA